MMPITTNLNIGCQIPYNSLHVNLTFMIVKTTFGSYIVTRYTDGNYNTISVSSKNNL